MDVLITHAPPKGVGDEDDRPHEGFEAFHTVIRRLRPKLLLHGHIHPHGVPRPDRQLDGTRIVNVIPYRLIELDP